MRFRDRNEAGEQLAQALADKYHGVPGIVFALPRGGLPLGVIVASALSMPLDLVIPRKIGHPLQSEYAICAVCEHGRAICNAEACERVDQAWLAQHLETARGEARRRRACYGAGRKSFDIHGVTVILVDDGLATGLTMRAAIAEVRARGAGRVIVAVPVAPDDTADMLEQEADEVVTLVRDSHFLGSIGAYYEHFPQLEDEAVLALLRAFDSNSDDA